MAKRPGAPGKDAPVSEDAVVVSFLAIKAAMSHGAADLRSFKNSCGWAGLNPIHWSSEELLARLEA